MTAYHNSPSKLKARDETIFKMYEKLFGRTTLPKSKQYWTLCAQCATEDGSVLHGSELHQAIKTKFIDATQFYGVDENKSIIKTNSQLKQCHWYNNNFIYAMWESISEFNPGIINFDSINGPKITCSNITSIMYTISKIDIKDVMIIANIITRNRGKRWSVDDIEHLLQTSKTYQKCIASGWESYPKSYTYGGSTGRSEMTSIIFYKK
jgi:hypothetical protein